MASGSSLTVSSVKEELNKKSEQPIHFLNFRFSTAHQKGDLEKIHKQIMKTGWQKLPDLESSYVWFGDSPPEVIDILKKASYDNHVCRYTTGRLTDTGELEGTGTAPAVSEEKSGLHATLFNYGFSKTVVDSSQIIESLPELKQVMPLCTEENQSD